MTIDQVDDDSGAGPYDPALVRQAQRGSARALEAVVGDLLPYLGSICGAIALEAGDDALQNAMVAVVRNLGALREPAALRGWARTIAVREAVRLVRSGPAVAVDPEVLADTVPSRGDDIAAVDVRTVLAGMAPEQRAVLVLRYLDGRDQREMAELLDVAPGTVKSRLSRARAAFRARWSS